MEELEILKKDNADLAAYVITVVKVMQTKAEKYNAVNAHKYEEAAVLRDQEQKLIAQLPAGERMDELAKRYDIKIY